MRDRDFKKCVIYARVSSQKQAASGLGMDDQVSRCSQYCAAHGLEVCGVLRDEVSASKPLDSRAAGAALVDMLATTSIGVVVVLKLDRAFRSAIDALSTVEKWEASGVALHMVDFGGSTIDTSTPVGKMFLTMMAGFAEFERGLIRERTKAAMAVKKRRGERVGRIPYGLRLVAGSSSRLERCPDESAIMATMVTLKKQGCSCREIARRLARSNVTNRGAPWGKSSVHRIVRKHENSRTF